MCPDGHLERLGVRIDEFVVTVIRERLRRPDVADLLTASESEDVRRAAAEIRRLRARLAMIEADYDADMIDGRRFKVATEKVTAELTAAEAAQARVAAGGPSALGPLLAADPVAAFDAAPLGIQQAVIRFFMVVRVMKAPPRVHFSSASVEIRDARSGELWSGENP
jgi:site-specific DNA recombinase